MDTIGDDGRVFHYNANENTPNHKYITGQLLTVLYRRYVLHGRNATRIQDKSNNDGTRTLTVDYNNGYRDVFIVRG